MCLDGPLADDQLGCDLCIREAPGKQRQHFAFARRELGDACGQLGARRAPAELVDHGLDDCRIDHRPARGDRVDGPEDVLRRRLLQYECARARTEGGEHVFVQTERRQHDDARAALRLREPACCFDPVEDRHAHVHQDHVRPDRFGLPDSVEAVARLTHDRDRRIGVDDAAQAGTDQRLVVREQHADRAHETGSASVATRR